MDGILRTLPKLCTSNARLGDGDGFTFTKIGSVFFSRNLWFVECDFIGHLDSDLSVDSISIGIIYCEFEL
jgi:hypothetical protein